MNVVITFINSLDIIAEILSIVLGVYIIYQVARMSRLFNETFRSPLRYFVAGTAINAFAFLWELGFEHAAPQFAPGALRDFLLTIGFALFSIAIYRFSVLVLGSMSRNN